MIFNKKGSLIKNRKLFVGGKAIKMVVNYMYLVPLTFVSSGKKIDVGVQNLIKSVGIVSIPNYCLIKMKNNHYV